MPSLEQRIQILEDRQALQELVSSYLIALDDAADLEQLLNHFTEDAVFDMTALDYPTFEGMAALRELFTGGRTHAMGMGVPAAAAPTGSDSVLFYVQYHLEFARINAAWKITSLRGQPLMPS